MQQLRWKWMVLILWESNVNPFLFLFSFFTGGSMLRIILPPVETWCAWLFIHLCKDCTGLSKHNKCASKAVTCDLKKEKQPQKSLQIKPKTLPYRANEAVGRYYLYVGLEANPNGEKWGKPGLNLNDSPRRVSMVEACLSLCFHLELKERWESHNMDGSPNSLKNID